MPRPTPTPAIHIDEFVTVEQGSSVRAVIELGSCGTPLRLSLTMNDLMKLGRLATATANVMIASQRDNVVGMPVRARSGKGRASHGA